MAARKTWKEIKAQRPITPEMMAAYERAGQALAIGRRIRQLREARGISQAELARRMGTTQSLIARLELGGAGPRFDTLNRVCRALDLELVVAFRPREAPVLRT